MDSVGKNIKKYRNAKKWNQKELSQRVGVSLSTISDYENDRTSPDVNMIMKICNALDIDANSFFDWENIKEKNDIIISTEPHKSAIKTYLGLTNSSQITVINIIEFLEIKEKNNIK